MPGEKVAVRDSAVVECLGLNPVWAPRWARGMEGRPALAQGLDYQEGRTLTSDKISRPDACVLAARIALQLGRDWEECADCDYSYEVNSDPVVQELRGDSPR